MEPEEVHKRSRYFRVVLGAIGALVLGVMGLSVGSPHAALAAPPSPYSTVTFHAGTASNQPPGSLTGDGAPPPSNPCYYSEWVKTWYDLYTFPDNNYMNASISVWQTPSSGCTQWAGHYWADTEVETLYNLGSAVDQFYLSSTKPLDAFGWYYGYYGGTPPTNANTPYGLTFPPSCSFRNQGWGTEHVNGNSACQAVWQGGTGTLTGTDGDTTLYLTSAVGANQCAFGGDSLIDASNYAQSQKAAGVYVTQSSSMYVGTQGVGPFLYYAIPNIYFDKPGNDCTG